MSESFLSRWSRRKRENTSPRLRGESLPSGEDPRVGSRSDPGEGASPGAHAVENPPHPDPLPASGEREFDPATLPPIESIDASTDVSVFLRPGVPADLAQAALRRAWVVDPAIRDFVGPAENAWDFNAPGGVPGFEPLRAIDDVRRLAAQVAGALPAAPEAATAEEATNIAPAPQAAAAATPVPPDETGAAPVDDAAAQDDTPADRPAASPRPRHGGALAE
ncbi:MAG TPA: DUF3306 domain-containing protein [Xanthobacteraceae bacterium]|jgi:hypothetical protein|nr:DUF3306 domain-containing protein [Xanthobacteraceae bacterium]